MEIEVQLASGEWISVSALDANVSPLPPSSPRAHPRQPEHVAQRTRASQLAIRYWLSRGAICTPTKMGVNIDTYC
ncbi:hypothetical protein AWB78_08328 [Caballeronia calidae]|uniref:Uncharacterized protein n=1 Tax=Caballeronia calidae TaxID=1777139 RepID=A0A158EJB1_9BURK|nr:hypothetical protein [Caballeronia calidae]SAL06939.1 hypothetical protein AWB78_08328 [Caballeronia calidae]